jgi:dihydroorotate dehydrogenase
MKSFVSIALYIVASIMAVIGIGGIIRTDDWWYLLLFGATMIFIYAPKIVERYVPEKKVVKQ